MKQKMIALSLATLVLCGCGSAYQTTSTLAGASIGGNVGGAIGGLVGSNRHWDGGYRGSAIGTLVGTLAGAAIGGAISSGGRGKQSHLRNHQYQPRDGIQCRTDCTDRQQAHIHITIGHDRTDCPTRRHQIYRPPERRETLERRQSAYSHCYSRLRR